MPSKPEVIVKQIFERESSTTIKLITDYLKLLFKWHETNNIISSSDYSYIVKREIYDSYHFNNHIQGKTFTDVGTGGGIPGIIVAILNPEKEITLLDRKSSFIDFLSIAKAELKLNNTKIVKQDIFNKDFSLSTDTALLKNFSNKKISKMDFQRKFIYIMNFIRKSKSISKVYMLTGTPVLELSEDCVDEFNIKTFKIDTPYFDTHRFIAEVKFEDSINS